MKNSDLTEKKFPITLDAIIFLILGLVAGRMIRELLLWPLVNNGTPELFGATAQEVALDLVVVLTFIWLVIDGKTRSRDGRRRFWLMLVAIITTIMFLSTWRAIVRSATDQPWLGTHDGVIQSEEAARMIQRGVNPYAASFRGTSLDNSYLGNAPDSNNLFTHYVYPPLSIAVSLPMTWLADAVDFPVELQFAFIAIFLITTGFLIKQIDGWPDRCLALLLTLGNPFIYCYIVGGYNDVLMAGPLLLGAIMLIKKRWIISGIMVGLALAAKQIAWFFMPLFLLLLWSWWRGGDPATRAGIKKNLFWLVVTTAIFYLPFIIWNAPALFDDLVRFPSGTIPGSYPVGGSTVWQFWVLADPQHYYFPNVPSQALQAVVGGILLLLLGRRLWQNPKISNWLVLSAALVLAIGVVGRFMYGNYLSTLALLATAGFFMAQYVETD